MQIKVAQTQPPDLSKPSVSRYDYPRNVSMQKKNDLHKFAATSPYKTGTPETRLIITEQHGIYIFSTKKTGHSLQSTVNEFC